MSRERDSDYIQMVSTAEPIKNLNIYYGGNPSFEQLLSVYTESNFITDDSMTILWFANWLEDQMKKDHGFCITFPKKEQLALVFIMEQVYGFGHNWHFDFYISEEDFKKYGRIPLSGGWIGIGK
jgi:hypothetical protein